ncbi:MAG: hypothetical protein SFV55_19580 [Haliscomenobacter sp.]|uniref:hypothetical protein n=1 Tax=Haliscomenobacter sp. TaxID=2717303 RepID=UPI0029A21E88|nr:hypothetical protein [Haliscomenobacter sp.]MDX2070638.1 hypothetical protein [Haliscomenobacter sp.]
MSSRFTLFAFFLFLFLSACNGQKPDGTPTVGGDKDKHGCIGSAGYQWSELRGECIRLFEAGIRLDPQAKELNQTTSAFIVFKSMDEDAKVELFLPGEKAMILPKVGQQDAGTWKNKKYTVKQWRGMYSVENSKKKLLYQGAAKK